MIVSAEFQNLLSFSWNCEVIVGSARFAFGDAAVITRAGQPEIQFQRVGGLGGLAERQQAEQAPSAAAKAECSSRM